MLALAGQPSLRGHHACMVCWNKGARRRNRTQKYVRPLFLLVGFFYLVRILGKVLGFNSLASLDWEGPAPWASLPFLSI